MARTWTGQDIWQRLNPYQRAAAMAIMEADGRNPTDARNVLGAIINRSERTGDPLGEHVSKPIYQPTIEMSQLARLPSILKSTQFQEMTALAERRAKGEEGDWVQGATHFLAPEKTMVGLHRQNPDKYHNWGPLPNSRGVPGKNWTGYDPSTGEYRGVIMRDNSHAFLAPEGTHQAKAPDPFAGKPVQMADSSTIPTAGDPLSGFTRPNEVLPAAIPTSTMVAGGASPGAIPAMPSAMPTGGDEALLFAKSFFEQDEQDQKTAQQKLAQMGAAAEKARNGSNPPAAPRVGSATPPRINMNSILSLLKERGVNLTGGGGLGTGGGSLGTRRA